MKLGSFRYRKARVWLKCRMSLFGRPFDVSSRRGGGGDPRRPFRDHPAAGECRRRGAESEEGQSGLQSDAARRAQLLFYPVSCDVSSRTGAEAAGAPSRQGKAPGGSGGSALSSVIVTRRFGGI